MANFKGYIIGMLVITVFIFLLALFAINSGNDYDLDVTDLEGGQTGFSQLNQTITEVHETAKGWKDMFGDLVDLNPFNDVFNLYTLFKTMWDILTTPFDVIISLFQNVFPIPEWFGDFLAGLFIASIIFAIWRLVRTGS